MPFFPPRPFEDPNVIDLPPIQNNIVFDEDLPVEVAGAENRIQDFVLGEALADQAAQPNEWAFLDAAQNAINPPIVPPIVINHGRFSPGSFTYSWGTKKKAIPFTEILEHLKGEATRWLHTGSRVICDPPVLDTDDDYLFLVPPEHFDTHCDYLQAQNFEVGGSRSPQDHTNTFVSYKRRTDGETLNVMLTSNISHFWSFVDATALAKKLNLVKKEDRIALFEAINRNVWPEIEVG